MTQYITGLLYKCTCTFETSSVCVSFTVVAKVVSALEELQNNTCDKLLAFNIPVFNSHVWWDVKDYLFFFFNGLLFPSSPIWTVGNGPAVTEKYKHHFDEIHVYSTKP